MSALVRRDDANDMSGDSIAWEGWGRVREHVTEYPSDLRERAVRLSSGQGDLGLLGVEGTVAGDLGEGVEGSRGSAFVADERGLLRRPKAWVRRGFRSA